MDVNKENNTDNLLPKPYPDLNQSWMLLLLFLLFSLGVGLLASPFSTPEYDSIKNWITLFSYVATFAILFFYVRQKLSILRQPSIIKFKKQPIALFILLLITTIVLSIVMEPLSAWIPMPDFFKDVMKDMVSPNLASFISVVIAAPLCEEVLCRGIILEGLLQNKMQPKHAIMWSSFIFAVLHLNPWQGIPAFLAGCLMGWVYYKTRSLWGPIFIHFVNNGFAFVLLMLTNNPEFSFQDVVGKHNYIAAYFGALVLFAVLLFTLDKYFNLLAKKQNKAQLK